MSILPANATEVIEVGGLEPQAQWNEYQASGLTRHLGGFHLCLVLTAMVQTGLADRLRAADRQTRDALVEGLNPHMTGHLLTYLAIRGILRTNDHETYSLTEEGGRLLGEISLAQLGFYLDAYSPVLLRMGDLMLGKATYGVDVLRNGQALAAHCATLFRTFHTPIIGRLMQNAGASNLLDLGCGGGMLLVDACRSYPHITGYGIDISEPAIEFAREQIQSYGLGERLHFHVGDAFKPSTWPEACRVAEAICAVGVLHEHFRDGESAVIEILNTYAELLRDQTKIFILGEPELYYDDSENDADLYLVHIFTAQGFPRRRERWLDLIERSELKCRRVLTRRGIGPRFCFYELALG